MNANVEPEEVDAIMGMMGRGKTVSSEVNQRDFKKPMRLSQSQVEELESALLECITPLGEFLTETIGRPCRVELDKIHEANAEGLFDKPDEHLAMLRFRSGGHPAWVVWDIRSALCTLECIFGASSGMPEARHLTRMEGQVLGNILASFAATVTSTLGMDAEEFAIVENEGQIGSWRDGAPKPDPHRLHLEFGLEGIGEPSGLHVYLPGFHANEGSPVEGLGPGLELPKHLERVEVELSVRLAECEITLNQLLALEEGDVIPTSVRLGDPATILVEGKELATGRLGTHHGHFAVLVEQMMDNSEESQ